MRNHDRASVRLGRLVVTGDGKRGVVAAVVVAVAALLVVLVIGQWLL